MSRTSVETSRLDKEDFQSTMSCRRWYLKDEEDEPNINVLEEWKDITIVGSMYEEQFEVYSSRRRHRRLSVPSQLGVGEWLSGQAPQ
jgi:hypothetical protein